MYDIRTKGEKHEGLSEEQVRTWIRECRVSERTWARRQGEEEWNPLARFAEFETDLRAQTGPAVELAKTKKLANVSLGLGIARILCGITALPGIIWGIRTLGRVRRDGENKPASRKAVVGIAISSCTAAFFAFSFLSALHAAGNLADSSNCNTRMKNLSVTVRMYMHENEEYPAADRWCDAIRAFARTNNGTSFSANSLRAEFQGTNRIPDVFRCPSQHGKPRCAYAFNRKVSGPYNGTFPIDTVMLFESDAGWNAAGGPEIAVEHHKNLGVNVAFVEGAVTSVRLDDLPHLRWDPGQIRPPFQSGSLLAADVRRL